MQLLVLLGGGVVVAVATVFAQNWVEARLAARRAARTGDGPDVDPEGDGTETAPGSGYPELVGAGDDPVGGDEPS